MHYKMFMWLYLCMYLIRKSLSVKVLKGFHYVFEKIPVRSSRGQGVITKKFGNLIWLEYVLLV